MARRCLYYPFIHFRDEAWLKLSALYWDDVSRIVPGGYEPRDTREVRTLEEAGVIRRVNPSAYERSVSQLFTPLLDRHEKKLTERYDVSARHTWPRNLERLGVTTGRPSTQSLAFIHASKLEPSLIARLLELRLALPSRDQRWLGMHPAIVSAYMIALAREISERRGLSPISDRPAFLSAVSSAPDDLARSLVSEVDLAKKRAPVARNVPQVTAERVAFVTLRAVLPARVDELSAKRIIALREEHAGARHAFHGYVEEVRAQLSSEKITDLAALDEHVRLEYERRLKPEIVELKRGLRSLGVGTFLGSVGIAVTLPLGSLLGSSPGAAGLTLAGATLGVAALSHRQRDTARSLLKPAPASFLFVAQQLRPRGFRQRVADSVRRFTLGV
jgi:beta-phosphoglucomutase-like phosphatase (HAD superfamily)